MRGPWTISRPAHILLLKHEGELAKLNAGHTKALDALSCRYRAETTDRAPALRHKVVVLKTTFHQKEEEGRSSKEIDEREQQKSFDPD